MREGLFILLLFIFCPLFGSLKYYFTLVNGGGCPYTASWLVSVDLFHLLSYEVTWHKMESVTWDVLKTSKWNFQFFNESSYFVHHMSQFEHFHRKKSGYTVSENLTSIYSNEALKGICMGVQRQTEDFQSSYHESSIALVPFYGGRPPNVTADFKVNSLGQGNSLVCIFCHIFPHYYY